MLSIWQYVAILVRGMSVAETAKIFRDVTRRVCGNLDIELALRDAFAYVRQFIPADTMGLGFHDVSRGHIQVVAKCALDGTQYIWDDEASKITLSSEQGEFLLQKKRNIQSLTTIVNRPANQPNQLLELFPQLDKSSALFMRLDIQDESVGTLLVTAMGPDRYSADHVSFLEDLREPFAIAMSNARRYKELKDIKERLEEDNRALQKDIKQAVGVEVIGADFGLQEVMEQVQRIAQSSSPTLLLGETGTGKEVIASAIHRASSRRKGPMISMQCGAIPETLLDSELFGHEKGAFTGATATKRGRFERADGGTLFLDEVGELSPEAQVKLLRVLQEKRFERVGGTRTIEVDVRVIAATHRDLEKMVREGGFREDLWYRLNVLPIRIPPLRLRREDIPSLIYYFVERKAREMNLGRIPAIHSRDLARLQRYDWPGNVRELQNVVERALILSRGEYLDFTSLSISGIAQNAQEIEAVSASHTDISLTLDEVMARHIRAVLDEVYWKVSGTGGAAEILNMKPSTLRFRMKKLRITKQKGLSAR